MLLNLLSYLSFPFIQHALVVMLLISLCAALLGVVLVLKRFSFLGDGLSHVAFGAMAVAAVTGLTNQLLIVLPVTVLSAVLLLRAGQNAKLKGDASIAILSVSALALGYLLMHLFPASANVSGDVCSGLFGSASILTLSPRDVLLCLILSLLVIGIFLLCYRKIFSVTFDETFARAIGIKTDAYNLLLAVVIAVIIVLAMKLVGSLLVSALIIFPALSAMRVCKSFRSVTLCAAALSVACALLGILLSLLFATPVGATVVAVDLLTFLLFTLLGKIIK